MKIQEYRELLKDEISSDEQIQKRLDYLEALCRNVIRIELGKHLPKSLERSLEIPKVGKHSNPPRTIAHGAESGELRQL